MGTRSLTAVYADGKYRVAQYTQLDGYPSGRGVELLAILKDLDRKELREACLQCTGISRAELDRRRERDPNWKMPRQYSRDLGPEILNEIVDNGVRDLLVDWEFALDSLMCEWAYVVDLDRDTFEVYRGFNKKPLPEDARFYANGHYEEYSSGERYYPVRIVTSWPLDQLPRRKVFLDTLEPPEPDAA